MKTKFVFLFLSMAFICNAQSLKYITFNIPDVRQFSDSVALNAKEALKFESQGVWEDNKLFYRVKYTNLDDADFPLEVFFRIDMIGGTDDIVNPGTPQYIFNKITGKFIDLFPFWSGFIKTNADSDLILQKQKDETIVKGATYDFNVEKTHWTIEKF
jgi:hypothetical protein